MPRPSRPHALLLAGLAAVAMGLGCTPPGAADSDAAVTRSSNTPRQLTIGQIQLMPYRLTTGPWLPSEGQDLAIRSYVSLFMTIATMYGGNGTQTFAVPNLKQATPDPSLTYHILAQADDSFQQPLGMISLFATDFDPAGYAACDGRQLPRAGHEALAKAMNVSGDTITLPKLTAPLPGLRYAMHIKGQAYDEAYVGTVTLMSSFRDPAPWLRCEGQTLNRSRNWALGELVGSKFGEGGATFKLPDLRGKVPAANLNYCIAPSGIYPSKG